MKFLASLVLCLFFSNNLFSQTDISSETNNSKEDSPDSLLKERKYSNYISLLYTRFFCGEFPVFYERIKNEKRGYEVGVGYIIPAPFLYSVFTRETADHLLYGVSCYYSQKYYGNKRPLSYIAPEIILRYEYNNNISVHKDHNVISHVSQQRISPSLSVKYGHRDRKGISDFYVGLGAKLRYVDTQYLDPPNPNANGFYKIKQDYGWYVFPVVRIGLKIGLAF